MVGGNAGIEAPAPVRVGPESVPGRRWPYAAMLAAAVFLRSFAAVFAKQAALTSIGAGFAGIVINPWLLAELVALALEAVVWSLTLRRVALSVAYPFMSLVFGLNLAAAKFIFDETVEPLHVAGIAIIIAGVVLGSWPERRKS